MIYDCVRLLNTEDTACAQYFFALDILRYGKIFKIGHVS